MTDTDNLIGRDVLLKVEKEAGEFSTVAAIRLKKLTFNTLPITLSNLQSVVDWNGLLKGSEGKNFAVSGRGLFKDTESEKLVTNFFFEGNLPNYMIVIPKLCRLEGRFQITHLEHKGKVGRDIEFEGNLDSVDLITFVEAA